MATAGPRPHMILMCSQGWDSLLERPLVSGEGIATCGGLVPPLGSPSRPPQPYLVCLLYCLQIQDQWQPCTEQVNRCVFPQAFTPFMSPHHILVTLAIFQAFSLALFPLECSMISDDASLKAQITAGILQRGSIF